LAVLPFRAIVIAGRTPLWPEETDEDEPTPLGWPGLHSLPDRGPEGFHLHRGHSMCTGRGERPGPWCLHSPAPKTAPQHGGVGTGGEGLCGSL